MPPTPQDQVIVALDYSTAAEGLALVDSLEGRARWFKVGLQLYLGAGQQIVQTLRDRGFEVFLDLKLHDIPNTVAGAIASLSASGASLLTVHALGGPAMLAAAQAASNATTKLLAVTVLTSMDAAQLQALGIEGTPADTVSRLAALAQHAGIPGLVCSAEEVARLRTELGTSPLLVVPGIRPASHTAADDQRRTATPAAALDAGASMLVIGRPITAAPNPAAALDAILAEIKNKAQPG